MRVTVTSDLVLSDESESESESDDESHTVTIHEGNKKWPQSRTVVHKVY